MRNNSDNWWDTFRGNANTEKRLNLALSLDEAMADESRLKRYIVHTLNFTKLNFNQM